MNTKTLLGVSLAAVFAISMIFAGFHSAEAIPLTGPNGQGGAPKSFTIADDDDNTSSTMKVVGNAGQNIPKEFDKIFLYGFRTSATVGDDLIVYLVASHIPDDDDEQTEDGDTVYHGHRATLDPDTLCVTSLTHEGHSATLNGNEVSISPIDGGDGTVEGHITAVYDIEFDESMEITSVCPHRVYDQNGFFPS